MVHCEWLSRSGVDEGVHEAVEDGASREGGLLGAEGMDVGSLGDRGGAQKEAAKVEVEEAVGGGRPAAAVLDATDAASIGEPGKELAKHVPLTLGAELRRREALPEVRVRCDSSWSNARSSRRCVSASFCWMAMRSSEFSVFFSSSAAASCRCISSSWVTYSSHLGEKNRKKGGGEERIV